MYVPSPQLARRPHGTMCDVEPKSPGETEGRLERHQGLQCLLRASAYLAAIGHMSRPTSACFCSLLISALKLFTATSARPLALGPSPGVRVSMMPPSMAHFLDWPENSRPRSECILPMWKPSILSFSRNSIVVSVTFLAVLVTIGAARRKILMSKPLGRSSGSLFFFSGGGKRYGGGGGPPLGARIPRPSPFPFDLLPHLPILSPALHLLLRYLLRFSDLLMLLLSFDLHLLFHLQGSLQIEVRRHQRQELLGL